MVVVLRAVVVLEVVDVEVVEVDVVDVEVVDVDIKVMIVCVQFVSSSPILSKKYCCPSIKEIVMLVPAPLTPELQVLSDFDAASILVLLHCLDSQHSCIVA